jgi:hypothetical protein
VSSGFLAKKTLIFLKIILQSKERALALERQCVRARLLEQPRSGAAPKQRWRATAGGGSGAMVCKGRTKGVGRERGGSNEHIEEPKKGAEEGEIDATREQRP